MVDSASPPPPPTPPMNLHENTRQDSLSLFQGEERRKSSKGERGGGIGKRTFKREGGLTKTNNDEQREGGGVKN